MPKKIVIIGAVALGPKVACRARRLDPEAEIVVVDRDSHISYGGCGIPYYVGGDVAELEGLLSTAYHMKRDAPFFKNVKGVDVRPRTEAFDIDRKTRCVQLKNLDSGEEYCLDYDALVLATGGKPFVPPIPGHDLPGVMAVANLHHAEWIKNQVQKGQVNSAVVIGAGAIGLEMAEALTDLWGVETSVVEMQPQLLPQALGPDMARLVQDRFEAHDVNVRLSAGVAEILGDPESGVSGVKLTNGEELPCELVVMAAGARPNAELAAKAGLALGRLGGILVDKRLRGGAALDQRAHHLSAAGLHGQSPGPSHRHQRRGRPGRVPRRGGQLLHEGLRLRRGPGRTHRNPSRSRWVPSGRRGHFHG